MTWAAIIAALIDVLGPLLIEWLKQWLSAKLNAAAAGIDLGRQADAAVGELFDEAIRQTPRFALPRRLLLRRLRAVAVAKAPAVMAATFTLSPSEAAEIREVAELVQETE